MFIIDMKDEALIKSCELFNYKPVVAAAVDEGHSWWDYAGWGTGILLVAFLGLIIYDIFEDQKKRLIEANHELRRYRGRLGEIDTMTLTLRTREKEMNDFNPTDRKSMFNKIYYLYTKGMVTPEISKIFNDHKKRSVTNKPGARR